DALTYLHTRKPSILHRDIKPGNVKISPQGTILLVDFGLAKILQGPQPTTTGARAMTPGYSPPEQYGMARTDERTDIYSLGATLYAGLTGAIPEDGLARAMDNVRLTPLRRRNRNVSRGVAAAIEKAMAVDPSDRYQTAVEFKRALLGAVAKSKRPAGEFRVTPPPETAASAKEISSAPGTGGVRSSTRPPNAAQHIPSRPTDGKRRRAALRWLTLVAALLAAAAGTAILRPEWIPAEVRAFAQILLASPMWRVLPAP
ncbi:MAG TPA: serine/threonine-protein kinase, partial [Anaerolineales bacterium]|nr:serine/threonine-protein kinase [Anaerolineales bacterium]